MRRVASVSIVRATAVALLALAAGGAVAAQASAQERHRMAEAAKAGHRSIQHQAGPAGLDGRVQLMAKELDLDAGQQAALRRILLQHKAEVSRVWNDESLPGSTRVVATRAIGEQTAERIRAMLNDKQREKYIKPFPFAAGAAANSENLDHYLKATR